jgi:hypothetical protein
MLSGECEMKSCDECCDSTQNSLNKTTQWIEKNLVLDD